MKTFKQFNEANEIPTNKRTFKNIPKYATGLPKVKFTDWLGLKGQGSKGHDGKYYGWSHRAVGSFAVGDTIKPGIIGNKYEYTDAANKEYWRIADNENLDAAEKYRKSLGKFKPYKIETEQEAKEHALRFAKDVA